MADCGDDDGPDLSLDAPSLESEPPTLRRALVGVVRRGLDRAGWTVEQLADRVGVDRKTVSRVLNGHRAPMATLERLLAALDLEGAVAEGLEDVATDPGLDP